MQTPTEAPRHSAAGTDAPLDRLARVAAGAEIDAEVHDGVLNETPVLEIDRFNLWYGAKQALHRITTAIQGGNEALATLLAPLLTTRYPSQLIAALLEGLLLFVVLMLVWRIPRRPGVIAGWFFSLYAVVRIIGEEYRLPDLQIGFQLFGLTRGQWLSLVMLIFGLIFLVVASRRREAPLGGWRTRFQNLR
jgi:phosphatidylglycerol:prolipoprotein diacylglycerol transferase